MGKIKKGRNEYATGVETAGVRRRGKYGPDLRERKKRS